MSGVAARKVSGFTIERAEDERAPFVAIGSYIDARGPTRYEFVDPDPHANAGRAYRVVEWTSAGRGDVSPVAMARDGCAREAAGAGASASRRRGHGAVAGTNH